MCVCVCFVCVIFHVCDIVADSSGEGLDSLTVSDDKHETHGP